MLKDCLRGGRGWRKNDIWLQRDEVLRESLHQLSVGCPTNVDLDVSAVYPSQVLKCLLKSFDVLLPFRIALRACN